MIIDYISCKILKSIKYIQIYYNLLFFDKNCFERIFKKKI